MDYTLTCQPDDLHGGGQTVAHKKTHRVHPASRRNGQQNVNVFIFQVISFYNWGTHSQPKKPLFPNTIIRYIFLLGLLGKAGNASVIKNFILCNGGLFVQILRSQDLQACKASFHCYLWSGYSFQRELTVPFNFWNIVDGGRKNSVWTGTIVDFVFFACSLFFINFSVCMNIGGWIGGSLLLKNMF